MLMDAIVLKMYGMLYILFLRAQSSGLNITPVVQTACPRKDVIFSKSKGYSYTCSVYKKIAYLKKFIHI